MIRDPLALAAVIAAATGFAFWLHGQFRWASQLSATLLVIVLGAVLSNSGLVASESPVYDMISGRPRWSRHLQMQGFATEDTAGVLEVRRGWPTEQYAADAGRYGIAVEAG